MLCLYNEKLKGRRLKSEVGSGKTEGLIPPWRSGVLSEVEIGVGGLIFISFN